MASSSAQYVDYDSHFNAAMKRLIQPHLRKTDVFQLEPGMIKMGGGFPNPLTFPLLEADFHLRDGSTVHVDPKSLAVDLQYGSSEGNADLRQWLREFQARVHNPPTMDPSHPGRFDLILTLGAGDGINLAFDQLLEEDDWALCEEATYGNVMSMLLPIGARFHGIKTDNQGILPEDLDRVLSSWETLHPGERRPKLIFVVTTASNPTGVTWSLERKQAVYRTARAHDLMIMEDDAYYFLQFKRPLTPSFLSMDIDGRVIRFDTFSKIIAPGIRMGVVSGPAPIIHKMGLQKDVSTLHTGSPVQVMLLAILRHWGQDGLLRHCDEMMEFYRSRAELAVKYAAKHLTGLAEWNPPSGGMFLWLKIKGVKDSEAVVMEGLERKLVVVAGRHFMPDFQDSPHVRLNYCMASEEDLDEAFKILADIIREGVGQE